MDPFTIHYNPFNGAEVSLTATDVNIGAIVDLMSSLRAQKKQLVWLTLSITQSSLIPLFIEHGFVFHLCQEDRLTLICRIDEGCYAPFAPTHTIGVGGVVQNADGDVLLIRDRMMNGQGYKLPGGYVDLGETFEHAAVREVYEETGIKAEFNSMAGVISKYPHQFEKANVYIVCILTPLSQEINIQDTAEIEEAVWINPNTFIADENSSRFHRHLIQSLLGKSGLEKNDFTFEPNADLKREIFLKG